MKRTLPLIALLLTGLSRAADTYTSAGFLQLPAEANVGAMSAVAVDRVHGAIYVLHRGGIPLLRFDAKHKYVGGWGAGAFKVPHGLRIDSAGNVWITDNGASTVQQFSPDGKLLRTISEANGTFKAPDDLVFASNGDIYVADTGNARIVHLRPDGSYVSQWGRKGTGQSEFATAHGLAIDQQNRIYVADRNNNRVQVFTADGKSAGEWKGFGNPFGLLAWNGKLLVSEGEAHKIIELDNKGSVVSTWGGPDQLQLPHLMDYDSAGTLYVAEVNGKRVQMFRRETHQALEMFEQVHRPLVQPEVPRSKIAAEVTAELTASLPATGAQIDDVRVRNYVDQFVFARMKRDKVPHAELSTDEEFVRRAYLDATGRIPSPDDVESFLAAGDPNKREKLIDKLVSSDAFVDRWAFYFEDLFRAGGRMGSGLNLFHFWIREWLSLDRPYNEVVTDLLTGAGKTSFSVPAGMYYGRDFVKAKDDPTEADAHDLVYQPDTADEFTITYSKVFLGLNLACISCHDGKGHLEKVNLYLAGKKRDDFYGQAAFFGKTRQIMNWENGYQANTEFTVDDRAPGYDTKAMSMVRVPRHGGKGDPRYIVTGEAPRAGQNARDELARMITGDIQFSRAFANRIWAEFMGFGIVEPVDEFDLSRYDPKNPPPAPWSIQPSNPELLDAMARDFSKNNFSFRHLVQTIMKSSAYQLSSRFTGEWKEEYASYYARKYVRMLSAAELHDAIVLATALPSDKPGADGKDGMVMQMPEPGKAAADVKSFLRVFGQSNRDDMPKKVPHSSLQAMLLMQSRIVNDRVAAKGGSRVEKLLIDASDDRTLVRRLYLSTVSRQPSPAELETAEKALARDRKRGAENLQWALINSPEFIFNY